MKPSYEQLLACTYRGGRVFLFEYPLKEPRHPDLGCCMPSDEAHETITRELENLPGCKSVEGPFVSGVIAITISDSEQEERILTDKEMQERIATIFSTHWQE